MEIWKALKDYEGLYEVSNMGRLRRYNGKILKPFRTRNGYIHAVVVKDGVKKQLLMHRAVAIAFIKKPKGKDIVNHINNNPSDNRAENLEWCTQSENIKYSYDQGRGNNVARKKIVCVDTGHEYYSSMEAATWINKELFHDSHNLKTISRTIRSCANGDDERKQAYGYRWKFSESEGSTTIP